MSSIIRNPFILPAGRILRIENGPESRIRADSGFLWITFDGDVRDHILAPGQSLYIEKGGVTLVQALEASSFMLITPAPRDQGTPRTRLKLVPLREAASQARASVLLPLRAWRLRSPARFLSAAWHALPDMHREISQRLVARFRDTRKFKTRAPARYGHKPLFSRGFSGVDVPGMHRAPDTPKCGPACIRCATAFIRQTFQPNHRRST